MTDAPEQIWARTPKPSGGVQCVISFTTPSEDYGTEYVRADLADGKIDGLESDLQSAVRVAFNHGAHKWVSLNYPAQYASLRDHSIRSLPTSPEGAA